MSHYNNEFIKLTTKRLPTIKIQFVYMLLSTWLLKKIIFYTDNLSSAFAAFFLISLLVLTTNLFLDYTCIAFLILWLHFLVLPQFHRS